MNSRRTRFKRDRSVKTIELTARDVQILEALYRYRFLTSEHLLSLTGSTNLRTFNRRLRLLYDTGYLDRPAAQMHSRAYAEKRPMVYALGNQGASFLLNRFQLPLFTGDWTDKNKTVKERFVEHTLGIADFMISVEIFCRNSDRYEFVDPDTILSRSPQATKAAKQPFAWRTRIRWDREMHELSIVPDAVFGLVDSTRPEGRNTAYFFVEIDRGTMPVSRKDVRQTSFLRKLYSYADTHTRKLHMKRFDFSNFRVLTVTTSAERIMTLRGAYESEISTLAPAGMFLFGSKADLAEVGALTMPWVNAKNEVVSIV